MFLCCGDAKTFPQLLFARGGLWYNFLMKFSTGGRVTLSIVLLFTLLSMGLVFYQFLRNANAGNLSGTKDVLSNSAPGATSTHTITFVTATAVTGTVDKTITVNFGTITNFTIPAGATSTDVDLEKGDTGNCTTATFTQIGLAQATTTDRWGAVFATSSTNLLTLTYPANAGTSSIAAGVCVRIKVGGNATSQATGTNNLTNPSKVLGIGTGDVYTISIGGSFGDSGNALVAVVEGVTVSATVAESLTFNISGVSSGSCTSGKGGSGFTATSTTSSTIPFGVISTGFSQACQSLYVATNAFNGYNLTAQTNQSLSSGSSTIPDTTCDSGACTTATAAAWVTDTNEGFGYSCDPDTTAFATNRCQPTFTSSTVFRPFSSSTAVVVASSTNILSALGSTNRILYRITVDAAQAAGNYSNVITWIATPSY